MANTLAYVDQMNTTADGSPAASILPSFTGASPLPLASSVSLLRFATSFAPSGAGTVADLFMVGGDHNPRSWILTTYTATGTVLSAALDHTYNDYCPPGSAGYVQTTILNASAGGLQGTYANAPWLRFATSYAPVDGLTVCDLVMTGGLNDKSRWSVIVYTVTSGVLS